MKKTLFLTISILSLFFLLASPVKAACVEHNDECSYSGEACCDDPTWKCSDGYCRICGHSSRQPCCGEPQKSGFCDPNLSCRRDTHMCCVANDNKSNEAGDCCSGCRLPSTGDCTVCPAATPAAPAAGGEEGIDFEGLSGAIPSLKPIFQAGENSAGNVGGIISTILPYLFVFAGLLLLFYLIYGGFHMMIAAGDEKGLAEAKGKITNALVGFLLLFISYWLVQVVEFILGIKIF